MSAVGKVHSHNGVAGIEDGELYRPVGVGSAVRLHVGVFATEYFAKTFLGDFLCYIAIFATAVISFTGITFCVFVGKHASATRHNSKRNEIFTRYKFDVVSLSRKFGFNRPEHFFVVLFPVVQIKHFRLVKIIQYKKCTTKPLFFQTN